MPKRRRSRCRTRVEAVNLGTVCRRLWAAVRGFWLDGSATRHLARCRLVDLRCPTTRFLSPLEDDAVIAVGSVTDAGHIALVYVSLDLPGFHEVSAVRPLARSKRARWELVCMRLPEQLSGNWLPMPLYPMATSTALRTTKHGVGGYPMSKPTHAA